MEIVDVSSSLSLFLYNPESLRGGVEGVTCQFARDNHLYGNREKPSERTAK